MPADIKLPSSVLLRAASLLAIAIVLLGAQTGQAARPLSAAPASKSLRVMTYNIHVGIGMDKKLNLQRIADVINREHPDLVGLQEVDRGVKRTEGKDEIAELAAMTRMHLLSRRILISNRQLGI